MVENLRRPSRFKQFLEKRGIRDITPGDITPDRETLEQLYKKYPDLAGDRTAIGWGDEGKCQSWRGNSGWWRKLVGK